MNEEITTTVRSLLTLHVRATTSPGVWLLLWQIKRHAEAGSRDDRGKERRVYKSEKSFRTARSCAPTGVTKARQSSHCRSLGDLGRGSVPDPRQAGEAPADHSPSTSLPVVRTALEVH